MGDAVLCTPALRALRNHFHGASICFLAAKVVRDILSPSPFNDEWMSPESNIFKLASKLRKHNFSKVILFKNSFGCALTVWLAGISERIGYDRDCRGIFLTRKLKPLTLESGGFKAASMVDYYLSPCGEIGCNTENRRMELSVSPDDQGSAKEKLPGVFGADGPVVILVPGGAFGPSKCWLSGRFAETADKLIEKYNATVVVSVAPNDAEIKIANEICSMAKHEIISLASVSLSLGELKVLIGRSELMITNDTGPRHIAIALERNLVTLFGPNNPDWTQTGYENETQIIGRAECVPCDKAVCKQDEHLCMESITVEEVCDAAAKYLGGEKEQR